MIARKIQIDWLMKHVSKGTYDRFAKVLEHEIKIREGLNLFQFIDMDRDHELIIRVDEQIYWIRLRDANERIIDDLTYWLPMILDEVPIPRKQPMPPSFRPLKKVPYYEVR